MFGEHESESPRVPSPWDPFLPSPPNGGGISPQSNAATLHNGIPKLVPEVEEGNVEYKLKLTHISNARFARLVTQLKWRLLEGGGQAYYELGVADSGALIGLSRTDLEESLETLEMMAGEIGASVIVVKEIEVPPTIAALADKESGYTDPDTGEWTHKMCRRPRLSITAVSSGDSSGSPTSATPTEGDTDISATDLDDVASSLSSATHTPGIATPSGASTGVTMGVYSEMTPAAMVDRHIRSDPARPTAQSSPSIAPIDDDLALFSMEPEPAFREESGYELDVQTFGMMVDDELEASVGGQTSLLAGLEIAAVYKPRPIRRRERPGVLGPTLGRHGKRYRTNKEKKVQPWQKGGGGQGEGEMNKETKALERRVARDKKRETKRNALMAVPAATGMVREAEEALAVMEEANVLVRGMDGLHACLEAVEAGERSVVRDEVGKDMVNTAEARLIVEALVVRKMSIEEATLDFGRLALLA